METCRMHVPEQQNLAIRELDISQGNHSLIPSFFQPTSEPGTRLGGGRVSRWQWLRGNNWQGLWSACFDSIGITTNNLLGMRPDACLALAVVSTGGSFASLHPHFILSVLLHLRKHAQGG